MDLRGLGFLLWEIQLIIFTVSCPWIFKVSNQFKNFCLSRHTLCRMIRTCHSSSQHPYWIETDTPFTWNASIMTCPCTGVVLQAKSRTGVPHMGFRCAQDWSPQLLGRPEDSGSSTNLSVANERIIFCGVRKGEGTWPNLFSPQMIRSHDPHLR